MKKDIKKQYKTVLAVLLTMLMIASGFGSYFGIIETVDAETTESTTFYSSTSDGYISEWGSNYNTIWNAAEGDVINWPFYISVGQAISAYYQIDRAFLFFDTSSIPDGSHIRSASLSIYGYKDYSEDDFYIEVQNGQPTYPHDPLESGDYDKDHYSGVGGGAFHSSDYILDGYNTITLNPDGRSWINKQGTTKLCLRSQREIDGNSPTGKEFVTFYPSEKGGNYRPKLTVEYTQNPPGDPSNLDAYNPTSSSIQLSWTMGSGSDYTMIRRKTGSYPTSPSDGSQAYYGTGTSTTDTGLNCGTTYYYRAWAYDSSSGLYSTGYSSDSEKTQPCNQPPTAYIDSISPNPANEGDTVYFSGHGEDSDGYITGYNWRSSIDGQLSTQASFNTNSLSPGLHIIFFKVKDDDNDWSIEVSETLTIVPQQPDLIVTSINIPAHPFNTRKINMLAVIKNIGDSASPSFTCGLYVDGETNPTSTTAVSGIQPDETRTASFNNIQLDAGSHTIKVVADINNVVLEANENNNDLEETERWIYAFNLTVSLNWDADSFINELHDAFKSASNYLFDLTDGQMCYDSIDIEENSANWITADIQIQEDYYVRPEAIIGGIDHDTWHIYLGQKWYSTEGAPPGQAWVLIEDWSNMEGFRTIDHEFGHYGLYLFDEYYSVDYNRFDNCTGGNVAGDDSGAWSAMCNQINSTEFCNPTNHNNQNGLPAVSCWTTMNNNYAFLTIPTTVNPGPNDNVGQYMDFTGLAPSPNPPWDNTKVNWLKFGPVYPQPNQEVSVIINVFDPDGINQVILHYSVNQGGYITIPMQHAAGENYSISIPGQSNGDNVYFYFEINDNGGYTFKYPVGKDFNYTVECSYPDWDIDCDGDCDLMDVNLVCLHYGEDGSPGWIREDIDDDGDVDLMDVNLVCLHYGEEYGPPNGIWWI